MCSPAEWQQRSQGPKFKAWPWNSSARIKKGWAALGARIIARQIRFMLGFTHGSTSSRLNQHHGKLHDLSTHFRLMSLGYTKTWSIWPQCSNAFVIELGAVLGRNLISHDRPLNPYLSSLRNSISLVLASVAWAVVSLGLLGHLKWIDSAWLVKVTRLRLGLIGLIGTWLVWLVCSMPLVSLPFLIVI